MEFTLAVKSNSAGFRPMSVLPDILEFSSRALLDMILTTADHFTARDLSYALSAAYLARNTPSDSGTLFHLPDNRLRGALGLIRRDNNEKEDGRFIRLAGSSVMFGDLEPCRLPTTMFQHRGGVDHPVRHNLDDMIGWVIDPELIHRFTPTSPADVTPVPRALLAGATKLHGLVFVLKLLAMHAQGPGEIGLLKWDENLFAVQMTLPQLCERFGISGRRPMDLNEKYFAPAIDDAWKSCRITVEVELNRVTTLRNPKGKVKDAIVFMQLPEPSRILERLAAEVAAQPGTGWRSGAANIPRSKRAKPVPATNVVAFQGTTRQPIPQLTLPVEGTGTVTTYAIGEEIEF